MQAATVTLTMATGLQKHWCLQN